MKKIISGLLSLVMIAQIASAPVVVAKEMNIEPLSEATSPMQSDESAEVGKENVDLVDDGEVVSASMPMTPIDPNLVIEVKDKSTSVPMIPLEPPFLMGDNFDGTVPFDASVAEVTDNIAIFSDSVLYSGKCGTDVTWTLDSTGLLIISGRGDMTNYGEYSNHPWSSYRSAITSIVIEDSVTSIGDRAFFACVNLVSITIPNSITSIGEYAFCGCSNLPTITIPSLVESIGYRAFLDCSSLINLNIPDSVTSIGSSAFTNCSSLTNLTIGNSVKTIGSYAFYRCSSLSSVAIPSSVTSIYWSAFSECTSLTNVSIPNSVISIGDYAFNDCINLTFIDIPSSIESMGSYVFSGCINLTSANISEGVTVLGGKTFAGCTSLESITIPSSVKNMGSYEFSGCTSLTSVIIEEGVTSIPASTFSNCTSLSYIIIPASVTQIFNKAFYNCSSLTDIYCTGIQEQYNFTILSYNTDFTRATFHYNSTGPTDTEDDTAPDDSGSGETTNSPTITLNTSSCTLSAGTSMTLTVNESYYKDSVHWVTTDESVVKVENGKITAMNTGVATILAVCYDDLEYGECKVIVTGRSVTELDLWGLSGLVYKNLDNYSATPENDKKVENDNNSIEKYIEKANPYKADNEFFYTVSADYQDGTINRNNYYSNELGGYKILDTYRNNDSGFYAAAFEDCNDGIVIAFRGSETNDFWNDWVVTDGGFFVDSGMSEQFIDALIFYYEIKNTNPSKEIRLTGHSLGGALATFVSIITNEEALTFNGAGGLILEDTYYLFTHLIDGFNGVNQWNFRNYYNEKDLLVGAQNNSRYYTSSYLNNGKGAEYYPSVLAPHHLNTFITHDSSGNISLAKINSTNILSNSSEWKYTYENTNLGFVEFGAKLGYKLNEELKKVGGAIQGALVFAAIDFLLFRDGTIYLGHTYANDRTFSTDWFDSIDSHVFFSAGNYEIIGDTLSDDIFVAKDGDILYGKGGDDQYIIHEDGGFNITIEDSSGDDSIFLSNIDMSDVNVQYVDGEYILYGNGGGGNAWQIKVDVKKYVFKSDMSITDMKGDTTKLSILSSKQTFATPMSLDPSNFVTLRIYGNNLKVSILDKDMKVLDTFTNNSDEVSVNEFGYVYPSENGLELEVMNDGKYVCIEEGTNVSINMYTMESLDDTLMYKFDVNLDGHDSAMVNTGLDEEINFYYLDGTKNTKISVAEFSKVSEITSNVEKVAMYTGETEEIVLNVAPNNVAFPEVGFTWKNIVEGDENATLIATVSQNEDGTVAITGIEQGSDTLIVTAKDGSGITLEIQVTVQQDLAPDVTMKNTSGAYSSEDWSDSPVTITGVKNGYNTIVYAIEGEAIATTTSPTITQEGKTSVTVYAIDSSTGKRTASTTVEICVDTGAPEITGVVEGGEYYIPKLVHVRDTNYDSATLNASYSFTTDDYFTGLLVSEVRSHTVSVKDETGNETKVSFEIKALPKVATIEILTNVDEIEAMATRLTEIRKDFLNNYYDIPSSERDTWDSDIRALEDALAKVQDPTNDENDILSFTIDGQVGYTTLNSTSKTISLTMPYGTDLTNLTPSIQIPFGTSISPIGTQDFRSSVTYTVTAISKVAAEWTVTVTVAEDSTPPILEDSSVSGNSIMLEFDDVLMSKSISSGMTGITLVSKNDPTITLTVASVNVYSQVVVITFEESFDSLFTGDYLLTISSGMFENAGGTPNTVVSKTFQLGTLSTEETEDNVPVTNVSLNKTSVTLDLNGTKATTLTATVSPTIATNKAITWTSLDSSVASVSTSGVVTGLKTGTTTITVTTVDGGKTATCTVYVNDATGNNSDDDSTSNNSNSGGSNNSSSNSSTSSSTTYTNTLPAPDSGIITMIPSNPKSGDTVTLEITPNEGYEVSEVLVRVTSTGAEIEVTLNDDGTYSFVQPSGAVTIEVLYKEKEEKSTIIDLPIVNSMSPNTFNDMTDPTLWYYDPVKFVYDRGLMAGTSATEFSPNTATSRGMIVQVLYNLAGKPTATGTNFSDVSSTDYFVDAVAWASSVGVAGGTGDNQFSPQDDMTREELVVMLYAYEKIYGSGGGNSGTLLSFADSASVNSWAEQGVAWATEQGIIVGKGDNAFDPHGSAKRCEVAQILKNFIQLYV